MSQPLYPLTALTAVTSALLGGCNFILTRRLKSFFREHVTRISDKLLYYIIMGLIDTHSGL